LTLPLSAAADQGSLARDSKLSLLSRAHLTEQIRCEMCAFAKTGHLDPSRSASMYGEIRAPVNEIDSLRAIVAVKASALISFL
jgi:hypothetical protein